MTFEAPYVLPLILLALLPLLAGVLTEHGHPSLAALPSDPLSTAIAWALRALGVIGVGALVLGLAGAALPGRTIEHVGQGAHIALLIDRSASMDDTFAGRTPSGDDESKSHAAKRLLLEFVDSRIHDNFGVSLFSTSPIAVLPITDQRDAIRAAISAIDRPALAFTDIGRGLAVALDTVTQDTTPAEKAILIVSDGAAVIELHIEELLRREFARHPLKLYWLYLRTAGSKGIHDVPPPGEEDTPQALPERHLNLFFESLKVPYRAFEAESPAAVQTAINEIGKLERRPVVYVETIPRYDLSPWLYRAAAVALAMLLAARLLEATPFPSSALPSVKGSSA